MVERNRWTEKNILWTMKINWIVVAMMAIASIMGGTTTTQAQEALKQFTLEDLNYGGNNYHNMTAKNRFTTWWGDELVRLDMEQCYLVNKKTGKEIGRASCRERV